MSGNKNDARDAEAIRTAAQQPGVRTVTVKSEEQIAIQGGSLGPFRLPLRAVRSQRS